MLTVCDGSQSFNHKPPELQDSAIITSQYTQYSTVQYVCVCDKERGQRDREMKCRYSGTLSFSVSVSHYESSKQMLKPLS